MRRMALLAAFGAACLIGALAGTASAATAPPQLTPLTADVPEAPIPFRGSDGRTHLVYEVRVGNHTPLKLTVQRVQVRTPAGRVITTLGAKAVAGRLQPDGRRDSTATMEPGTGSLLFVHITLPAGATVPRVLEHRITTRLALKPPVTSSQTGARVTVNRRPVVSFGAPLKGMRYISADSCCDATRHTRAALPVNGGVVIAQRYAVDWEQLYPDGRIYIGEKTDPRSYAIYGQPIYAVADGRVSSALDGLRDEVPGVFPAGIPLANADGNHVVLDVGGGNYVLFAHMQPGSVRVKAGDRVRRGDVIGLVGNSGNSVAPHLHVHVTRGPSPIASEGVPYGIDSFTVTGRTPGTAAFDRAEGEGVVLPVTPFTPPLTPRRAMPLDQLIIDFD